MFTTAVDKLLSQFFALSAEERSCILEVLLQAQPLNSSDDIEPKRRIKVTSDFYGLTFS